MFTKSKTRPLRWTSLVVLLLTTLLVNTSIALADTIYWTTKSSTMPTPRTKAASAVINGNVYVLGGATVAGMPPSGIVTTVEMYNPSSDTWQSKPPLSAPRFAAASVVIGDIIYVIGGGSQAGGPGSGGPGITNTVLAYNAATGSCTQAGTLQLARFRAGAVEVGGKIYVVGGSGAAGASTSIEEFVPNPGGTGTSDIVGSIPEPKDNVVVCAVGQDIYIFGGWNEAGAATKTCYVFNTVSRTTTKISDMVYPRAGFKGAFYRNGKIILGGGVGDFPPTTVNSQAQQYDPATNSWTVKGSVPQPALISPAAEMIGNIVYLIGGDDSATVYGLIRAGEIVSTTDNESAVDDPANATCNLGDGTTVKLKFPAGSSTGTLSVSVAATGPKALPGTVVACSQYYDIATSVNFSGNIEVTVPYDPATADPDNLTLYHWDGNEWDALPTTVNKANNTVTGISSSLSPFVVGQGSAATEGGLVGYGMNTDLIALVAGLLFIAGVWLIREKRVFSSR